MRQLLLFLVLISIIFSSCKKGDSNSASGQTSVNTPSSFVVKVIERGDTYAIIQWTRSTSLAGDISTYAISLGGSAVVTNLNDTTYKITSLVSTQSYQGQVTASNSKEQSTPQGFTISPNNSFILGFAIDPYNSLAYFNCDTFDGAFRWQLALGTSVTSTQNSAATKDTVFIASFVGVGVPYLYALNTNTGTKYWNVSIPQYFNPGTNDCILYQNNIVYTFITGLHKIIAFDAKTGQQLWQITTTTADMPYLNDGAIYCTSYQSNKYSISAYDAKTGTLKWNVIMPGATSQVSESNGAVYFFGYNGGSVNPCALFCLNAQTGVTNWAFNYNSSINSKRPLIIGNGIYFVYNDPSNTWLAGVNAQVGTLLWQTPVAVTSSTVFGNSKGLYIVPNLKKYDISNGKLLWTTQVASTTDNYILLPDRLITHGSGTVGIATKQDCFFIVNSTTGQNMPQRLNGLESSEDFIAIFNGEPYYPLKSGMYRPKD